MGVGVGACLGEGEALEGLFKARVVLLSTRGQQGRGVLHIALQQRLHSIQPRRRLEHEAHPSALDSIAWRA